MECSTSCEEKSSQDFIDLHILRNNKQNNSIEHAWNSFKLSYARRLLSLTLSDNIIVRDKALKKLASIKKLDDWHCSLLANSLDARTAIALARTKGVDPRFFIRPQVHYANYSKRMLVNELKELLIGLEQKSKHVCMQYFISKVFIDEQVIKHKEIHLDLFQNFYITTTLVSQYK